MLNTTNITTLALATLAVIVTTGITSTASGQTYDRTVTQVGDTTIIVKERTSPSFLLDCGIAAPAAYFESGTAKLNPQARNTLDVLAECLTVGDLADWGVTLNGHTDERGTLEGNYILAQQRVETVTDYLLSKGVPGPKIDVTARGEVYADDDGMLADDRKVSFRITPLTITSATPIQLGMNTYVF